MNKFRSKKGSNLIPTLTLNNQDFKTDEEKGELIGKILSSTFRLNSDLNNSQPIFNEPISLNEMIMSFKLRIVRHILYD
ncbi:hypothetical protein BpHYR1_031256 [Brachionus plicatilis]|uniref:Uncharacterized protein n=1 Tax=Brachionus plicatilis TaxID=10195 RepID=A0A3M7S0B6_BRAPC|nr:hypothetical protein BpHYR1_031256 [Brachionus plicatilis]